MAAWVRRAAGGTGAQDRTSAGAVLGQCPLHVFTHQRRGIIDAGMQRGQRLGRGRCVAQRHGDVAQPAFMAAAADRAAFGAAQEFCFVPGEQLVQARGIEVVACTEVGFVGALGELVPGADQLAVETILKNVQI